MSFSSFDFNLLQSADFKEDSVREELVSPLLKLLGYSASGPNRIVRSKVLTHPFVYIGTKKHGVKIVPDYVLEVQGTVRWVLDAKGPREAIRDGANVQQAFSYAIHPDIRADVYALCNGHELTIFSIKRMEPLLIVKMQDVSRRWDEVKAQLSPLAFTNPAALKFLPDFGLYCLKLGVSGAEVHHFYGIGLPSIAKINDSLYSASLNIKSANEWYMLSLDFGHEVYQHLLQIVSSEHADLIKAGLSMQPFQIDMDTQCPVVNISARLGEEVITNNDESYVPLVVERFDAP